MFEESVSRPCCQNSGADVEHPRRRVAPWRRPGLAAGRIGRAAAEILNA
jgi:hypothetical protein